MAIFAAVRICIAILMMLLQAATAVSANATNRTASSPEKKQAQFATAATIYNTFADNVHSTQTIIASSQSRDKRHIPDGVLAFSQVVVLTVFSQQAIRNCIVSGATPISRLLLFPKHHFW